MTLPWTRLYDPASSLSVIDSPVLSFRVLNHSVLFNTNYDDCYYNINVLLCSSEYNYLTITSLDSTWKWISSIGISVWDCSEIHHTEGISLCLIRQWEAFYTTLIIALSVSPQQTLISQNKHPHHSYTQNQTQLSTNPPSGPKTSTHVRCISPPCIWSRVAPPPPRLCLFWGLFWPNLFRA